MPWLTAGSSGRLDLVADGGDHDRVGAAGDYAFDGGDLLLGSSRPGGRHRGGGGEDQAAFSAGRRSHLGLNDAALLLARCVIPSTMQPGWLKRCREAPVILPESIVCDDGTAYWKQPNPPGRRPPNDPSRTNTRHRSLPQA